MKKIIKQILVSALVRMKLLYILLFLSISANSQNYLNYYSEISKAEVENYNSKYKKADSIYSNAFKLVKRPFKIDFLFAALNAVNINDTSKVFEYLLKGFDVGLELRLIKEKEELNYFLKNSKLYTILKKEKRIRNKGYKKSLDKEISKMINKLKRIDHRYRPDLWFSILGEKYCWRKIKECDSKVYSELQMIFNKYGYPGFSKIGENMTGKYDFNDISLFLRHMSLERIDSISPVLIKAIKDGELYPYQYASAIDYKVCYRGSNKLNIRNNSVYIEQQIYGTLFSNGICTVVNNFNIADSLRKIIGLDSIRNFVKVRNKIYNYKAYTLEGYVRREFINKKFVDKPDTIEIKQHNYKSIIKTLDESMCYKTIISLIDTLIHNEYLNKDSLNNILFEQGKCYAFIGNYTLAKESFKKAKANLIDKELLDKIKLCEYFINEQQDKIKPYLEKNDISENNKELANNFIKNKNQFFIEAYTNSNKFFIDVNDNCNYIFYFK